jgi:hypothetical protein
VLPVGDVAYLLGHYERTDALGEWCERWS